MSLIPANLRHEHVISALQEILRHGVPRNRLSTKHCLEHEGCHFPPKYVISVATRALIPGGLPPGDFSGGPETNDVLTSLGFRIVSCSCGGVQLGGRDETAAALKIAEEVDPMVTVEEAVVITTCICAEESHEHEARLALLGDIVVTIEAQTPAPFLLVLPGGFLTSGEDDPTNLCAMAEKRVAELLAPSSAGSVICLGVDGREMSDQLGLAIDRGGLVAKARKFYPAGDEAEYLIPAESPWSQEDGKDRTFAFGGRRFYLAICYDSFGIKKWRVTNQGVEAVLNLVHGFTRPPEPGSGSFYFARDGMLGAARSWNCPVFGASHFWGGLHRNWPTAVVWDRGDMEHKYWRLTDNPVRPKSALHVAGEVETAHLAVYRMEDVTS